MSTELLIAGDWRPGAHGGRLSVENPATGQVVAEVADASPDDAVAALTAASDAFAVWRAQPPRERGECLRRAYELMVEREDELVDLIALEAGKPHGEAAAEVRYAAGYVRWYSEEAVRIGGRTALGEQGDRILTFKEPVGPVVVVTPWNFPLAMAARKIAPALAAGCTCVVKPAEQTPLTMLAFARLLGDAGLPAGVVNVVPTSDPGAVIEPLLRDPRTRKLSFTGSTAVGRLLLEQAAGRVLRTSMELGGNAPFIVLEDAELELAIECAVVAKLRNSGAACTAANRFLIHERVAAEFTTGLVERFDQLELGPLIDARERDRVAALVTDSVGEGARCLVGGDVPERAGYFYPPTVLTDVEPAMRIWREEIFGPVAPIVAFDDNDDVVALANDSDSGLAAYLFTRDLGRALDLAGRLECGMVGLNRGTVSNVAAPFGGVNQSGIGREGGPEGIEEYLETRFLALD